MKGLTCFNLLWAVSRHPIRQRIACWRFLVRECLAGWPSWLGVASIGLSALIALTYRLLEFLLLTTRWGMHGTNNSCDFGWAVGKLPRGSTLYFRSCVADHACW